jgi:DNA repair protein RecO (recombination protein O)
MIVRTEAIVLRNMAYGETSQIVTLFTQEKGKVAVLAKGARLPKSRFGSTLQPMSCVQVVFYHKPTRALQTLTESSHLHRFVAVGEDLEKIAVGLRLMELVSALLQDEHANPSVFTLVLNSLHHLDAAEARAFNVLPWFELHLAAYLGFAPAFEREVVEALPEAGGFLLPDTGTIVPAGTTTAGRRASRAALRAFAVFARADLDTAMRMRLDPAVRPEVEALVETYVRYHTEDTYPTRSDPVRARLLEPPPSRPST